MEEYNEALDVKNLLFYFLKKWRIIILTLLIGFILGFSFSAVKSITSSPQEIEVDISKLDAGNAKLYFDYMKLYDIKQKYQENSLLMNLDPNNVYTGKISYSITALEKNADNIANKLETILNIDNNLNKIVNINNKFDSQTVADLITISYEKNKNNTVSINEDYTGGALNINVYSDDKHFVERALEELDNIIKGNLEVISSKSDDVSYYKTQDAVIFGYNSELVNIQESNINSKLVHLNSAVSAKSKFTSDDKTYYDSHLGNKDNTVNNRFHISKKIVVLVTAGILGITLIMLFLQYLFDDRVKSLEEIKNRYNLPLLGVVKITEEKKNGVDALIDKLENKQFNSLQYINNSIKLLNVKKIMVCSEFEDFNKMLKKNNKDLFITGTVDIDKNSLELLPKYDGVILVSKNEATYRNKIQRQIDIINNASKKIIGVIGLE